ncbi:MAG: hypothetical protein GTO18_06895 [Anaerolineales bacterium]|nr:hypothetical protein [Anaerolineales bacterium]
MDIGQKKIRSVVRRDHAEDYILISLVAFALTVILTRVGLQLAGFPQLGNSVLHIAHALWGGLLLFVAVLLPLAWANRWALQASALLSGLGIGLFIDEVGKFITQTNDYFFPPALALIYGFFLLNVFVYLLFRRPQKDDPRKALYHAFEGLQDLLDGDLDSEEAARIENQLAIAVGSGREEIAALAKTLSTYLHDENLHLVVAELDNWKRIVAWVDAIGQRLGRRTHRVIISIVMILWLVFVIGFISVLILRIPTVTGQVIQWRIPLIAVQVVIGILMLVALIAWLVRNEELGLKLAISAFVISLVAIQMQYFYISQFSAITATLIQLVLLLILLSYRRWYLRD